MYESKTGTFGRVAVASLLSLGLTAGAVSIASAASHPAKTTNHSSVKAQKNIAFQGLASGYVAVVGTTPGSITVTNSKSSKVFTITSTTKILRASNVKNAANLATAYRVEVRALASAPLVATSINILGAKK